MGRWGGGVGNVLVVEGSEQVGEVNGLEVVVRRRQMVVVVREQF